MKYNYKIPNLLQAPYFHYTSGRIGVVLFFVISGFLITTLLLEEKAESNTIDFKNFYIRRILRVWPLYYTIIILGMLVLNYHPSWQTFILCITIFPNVAHMLQLTWLASPQIWSLGVEEQFYVFWPWVVSKSNRLLLVMVLIFLFFTFGIEYIGKFLFYFYQDKSILHLSNELTYDLKFNCMAAGGIASVLHHQKSKCLKIFKKHKLIAYGFVLIPFLFWFSGFHFSKYNEEFYSIFFSISIWNISRNEMIQFNPDNSVLKFLGKISYGIYMYHWIIFTLLMRYFLDYFSRNTIDSNVLLYTSSFTLTILVSTASYFYFEKWFLKMKERFN